MTPRLAEYRAFLERKVEFSRTFGAPIEAGAVHPLCKPHQRDIIRWAVEGGRRAIFAKFGLGKSFMQLETMRLTLAHAGGQGLIVAPLGVRQDFRADAAKLGIELPFVRTTAELEARGPGIALTNYESVREGKIDVRGLTAVSLDEASVLRGFGGTKTFREVMRTLAGDDRTGGIKTPGVPYRFVATATPSPNQYIEILAYAAFLGIMDIGEAKTRFFQRDSERADHLTLYPHKEEEFWIWVNTWAVFLQRPSDLGYSDDGYELPPLRVRWHMVGSVAGDAGTERDGQGRLLRDSALGVQEAAAEKRASLPDRINKVVEIVRSQRVHAPMVRAEQGEAEGAESRLVPAEQEERPPSSSGVAGEASGTRAGLAGALSHGEPRGCCGSQPGVVPTEQGSGECQIASAEAPGVRPVADAIRESAARAAREMCDLRDHEGDADPRRAAACGPRSHDGRRARAAVPSLQRGDRDVQGRSGASHASSGLSDQIIIWCDLNDEQQAIERALLAEGISVSSLYGSQDIDTRERLIDAWRAKETSVFLSKPTMYGSGINLQQSHTTIFAGVSFKFNDFVQAVHRVHRFLQEHECTTHIVYAASEASVVRGLQEKWRRHDAMMERMAEIIRRHGLNALTAAERLKRTIGTARQVARGDGWEAINNDSVEEFAALEPDRFGLIVTSIPFGTQYEYTPSYNDFGHTDSDEHFWAQMDFLSPELLRTLKPGRILAVHVKDRIRPGGLDGFGFQTVSPFHADAILHYRRHGFAYMGMITISTDVVRENNQTYRLGWTEQCKDGSRMSVGMPEYVLLFRKPPSDSGNGYADERVVKDKAEYSRARWQIDAHAVWRSSGNRLLTPDELLGLPADQVYQRFRAFSVATVYDYEHHVAIGEALEARRQLPPGFMLLPPQSTHPDVWTDVARMRTLNGVQAAKGREMHLCPLQFDIVDRLIQRFSNPGDEVADPFGGLMTVPLRAIQLGRRGHGVELNAGYWADGVRYLRAADEAAAAPSLFDVLPDLESAPVADAEGHDADPTLQEVPA